MNRTFSRITLALAVGLVALSPPAVEAQTTFTACRVPEVGAIYMIGVSGAPSACLDASHVEFSWTEGGALATGSVTSDVILDGTIATVDIGADAVTSAEIADGTITTADIGADAVTSAQIADGTIATADIGADAVTSAQIADGSITTTDIRDGTIVSPDLAASSVTAATIAAGAVGSSEIAANAVGSSELDRLVVTNTESSARSTDYISAVATCPTGLPIGGGWVWNTSVPGETTDATVLESRPFGTAWRVQIRDPAPYGVLALTAYAVCVG